MLVHPDKNMGNEKAAEAFKKLQNAYEVMVFISIHSSLSLPLPFRTFSMQILFILPDYMIGYFLLGFTWFFKAKSIWWRIKEGGAAKLFP